MNDEIYESVSAQIRALRTGPRGRWRKFRTLEVVCGKCGELLAEVMPTHPESVLLARLPVLSELDRSRSSAQRVGAEVMMTSFDAAADDDVTTVGCKCRKKMLRFGALREVIRSGQRRHVLS